MKKVISKLLTFGLRFLKVNPATFLIIESSYPSGSSTKIVLDRFRDKYKVDVIYEKDIYIINNTFLEYVRYIKLLIKISKYNVIICSHGFKKYNPNQILIDLWHGIPLKAMMYMESDAQLYNRRNSNADYLITSSKLESVMMNACTHIPYSNHKILGNPRNDYLFLKPKDNTITSHFKKYKKIILYMPTFRQGYADRVEGLVTDNIFSFDNFSELSFQSYLKDNNYLFVLKLHPKEEELFRDRYSKFSSNITLLSSQILLDNNIDLYQLLPYTDMLITDYSSIYFDYLLLNKPIVFINNDLNEYRKSRGILLEPYDYWTPGVKANDQSSLITAINKSFEKDIYLKRRNEVKEIFHYYQDGQSTNRVLKFIEEMLKG